MEKLGVKLGFKKDNLDKFSLEQANMILEALENSPLDITDSLEVMTIQKMKEKGYFPRDARYKPLQMNGVSTGDTIGFNYMKMKNLEKNKLDRNKEGDIFFNTSTKAMIYHELGHRFGTKRNP